MFLKKIDQDFLNQLLQEGEGLKLEYKQQISSQEKIAKTLSAMSNTVGGLILVGISDQRKIIGIDPEEEQFMIAAANTHFCEPRVSFETHTIKIKPENSFEEEKFVLLVQVHPTLGSKIFVKQKDGSIKAYFRIGNQSKHF
ncbi:MAG: ATP-binding protein [Bacteroidetes bacterium]|nr:ATP-binding protein [Bacteroidota bacterium]MDA1122575.1 ATP-binding protein [Bacteroidota bacterium]